MSATHREHRRDVRRVGYAFGALAFVAAIAEFSPSLFSLRAIASVTSSLGGVLNDVVSIGLHTAPALAFVILVALAFPVVAVVSRIVERSRRSREATRLYRRSILRNEAVEPIAGENASHSGPACLEVVGGGSVARYAIRRDMMRIGREDDNDIRISNDAVHRYHAAISREDLDDWRITDLSGLDGNGVIVNGRRCGQSLLHDGDVIQLGPSRLRFRAGAA